MSICTLVETETNTTVAQPATETSTTAAQVGAVAGFAGSSLSISSQNGFWQTLNIAQLFIIFIMLDVNLPKRVSDNILSNAVLQFSFDFLHIEDIFIIHKGVEFFDEQQSDQQLKTIGIHSSSIIVNLINHLFIFIVICAVHL